METAIYYQPADELAFADTDGADVAASLANLNGAIYEALQAAFPAANIFEGDLTGDRVIAVEHDDEAEAGRIRLACEDIINRVHGEGSWVVATDA